MPILTHARIYPTQCRAAPDTLFVFGDNMLGVGYAGQACIRDEPNALGIPTKHEPSMRPQAFFDDACLGIGHKVRQVIDERLEILREAATSGKCISLPADGIGTGMAQLPFRAPALNSYLVSKLNEIAALARKSVMNALKHALPCPFCAGQDLTLHFGTSNTYGFVVCYVCAARGPAVRTEWKKEEAWAARAIDEWNRRTAAALNRRRMMDALLQKALRAVEAGNRKWENSPPCKGPTHVETIALYVARLLRKELAAARRTG